MESKVGPDPANECVLADGNAATRAEKVKEVVVRRAVQRLGLHPLEDGRDGPERPGRAARVEVPLERTVEVPPLG